MSETEYGRISLRLPPEIHEAYEKRAKQMRRTMSEEIRIALEAGMIPFKGKVNSSDKHWPRKTDKKGK